MVSKAIRETRFRGQMRQRRISNLLGLGTPFSFESLSLRHFAFNSLEDQQDLLAMVSTVATGYPLNFRSYETDEIRRGWKKGRCPIYGVGTLSGIFKRVSNLAAPLNARCVQAY